MKKLSITMMPIIAIAFISGCAGKGAIVKEAAKELKPLKVESVTPERATPAEVADVAKTGLLEKAVRAPEGGKPDYVSITVFYGTDRNRIGGFSKREGFYGNDRGTIELGTCEVTIPKDHRMGELESPHWWKFEFREDPARHVVLQGVELLPKENFYSRLRERVAASPNKDAFVFVHGYNVVFEDAARRTGQMAYDLGFKGAPIFYSWPSRGKVQEYTIDENNVEWTIPHLKEFIMNVATETGARSVHLIAHSMGTRALTNALRSLAAEYKPGAGSVFNEIILAAPDIDAEIFKRDIVPNIRRIAKRLTLYASSKDKALDTSAIVHGYPRAGDAEKDILVIPGLDTIDASEVDTSLLGHSYYGDNRSVISDIFLLLNQDAPPEKRNLQPMDLNGNRYWLVKP